MNVSTWGPLPDTLGLASDYLLSGPQCIDYTADQKNNQKELRVSQISQVLSKCEPGVLFPL